MSTVKTNNLQIGQSLTATNNATWYQPASPDGTVRLGVGNSGATTGDIITVNSAGVSITGNLSVSGTYPAAFVAGTALIFPQSAAPTGWTKVTSYNDYALRIVSGSGGGTGGSSDFTTAFANTNAGATTLSTSQIPGHYHQVYMVSFAGTLGVAVAGGGDSSWYGFNDAPEGANHYSTPAGSGSSLYADATGGNGSHTHSLSLAVKYVDAIIATKN